MNAPRRDDGYEHAQYLAKSHYCPDCGGKARIVVRRNFQTKRDEAVCGCGRREGFVKRKSVTQVWRENPGAVDIATANKLADKYHDEIEAVADGLPLELGNKIREKYFGLPTKKETA